MADRSEIKCRSCGNSLGAWAGGTLLPAPYLLASRDIWMNPDRTWCLHCPRCHAIHAVMAEGLRLTGEG